MRMWLFAPLMAATMLSAALPSVAQAQERGERGNWGARSGGDIRQPRSTVPAPARETIDATRSRAGGSWRPVGERPGNQTAPGWRPNANRENWQGGPSTSTRPSMPRPSTPPATSTPDTDRTTWQQRRTGQNGQTWQTRDRNGDGIADATQRQQWRDRQNQNRDRSNGQDWRRDDNGRTTPGNRNWSNDNRYDGRNNGYSGTNWNRYNGQRLSDRDRWNGTNRWDRDWRRDNRYDWQRWRSVNRSYYHMPAYYAPYGWDYGYRRFSVGIFLTNSLFASNYWIDDPSYYRLPPAYGTLRWIRYYDDALLVDMRDGYVVDVVHDFFW